MNVDDFVEECLRFDMTEERAKELKSMVYTKPFKAFIGFVLIEINGLMDQLLKADLVTEEGRARALQLRGKIVGMRRVLDCLFDTIETTEKGKYEDG